MLLYRTDDFNNECSTIDIKAVLKYELLTKENESLFESISNLLGTPNMIGRYSLKDFGFAHDSGQLKIIDAIINEALVELNKTFKVDLKYAIWLYSKENVENYYSFEGFDAMIDGYEVSDICLIDYPNEGALYAFEENPKITERI